jgi:predicted metal-dependent peptidase
MILYEALLKLRDMPEMDFVSVILDHCKVVTDEKNPMSYVTWDKQVRRYKISVCQSTIDKGVPDTMRDIVHEVLHIVYNHFDEKYMEGDRIKWNAAMDCIINSNEFLQQDKNWLDNLCTFASVTGGRLNAKDHTSQDIYNYLQQQPKQQQQSGKGMPQPKDDHSQMDLKPDDIIDGKAGADSNDRPTSLVEMLGEQKAKEVAEGVGTKEVMDQVHHLIAANKELSMKREISLCLKRGNISKTNMKRPTRRPLTAPFGRSKTKNKLAMVIDTSGSMVCDPEMKELIAHAFEECRKIGDVEVFMGDCKQSAHYKDCKTLPELKGGGGSNFGWLRDIKVDQLIFVTDGYITDDSDCDVCSLVIVKGNNDLKTKARQVRV